MTFGAETTPSARDAARGSSAAGPGVWFSSCSRYVFLVSRWWPRLALRHLAHVAPTTARPRTCPTPTRTARAALPTATCRRCAPSSGSTRGPSNTTCLAQARPPSTAPVKFEQVFANVQLQAPMMMAQIPGDKTRWFVAQRVAAAHRLVPDDEPAEHADRRRAPCGPSRACRSIRRRGRAPRLRVPSEVRAERASSTSRGRPRAARAPSTCSRRSASCTARQRRLASTRYKPILGPFPQPYTNHNGGGIAFGKDGFLYFSFGDGGAGDDAAHNGQNKNGFFSKVLRIDVDNPSGGLAYGIPAGNPFKGGGGEPATFAMGFRNPFRFSIDRDTNEVWVGDVGQNAYEEIDAKVKVGGNYGWPCREGLHDSPNSADPAKCPLGPTTPGLIDPVVEHHHVPPNSRSITGGVVYRGAAIPGFVGTYVYGDYVQQRALDARVRSRHRRRGHDAAHGRAGGQLGRLRRGQRRRGVRRRAQSRCNLQASPRGARGPEHVPGSPLEDGLRRPERSRRSPRPASSPTA